LKHTRQVTRSPSSYTPGRAALEALAAGMLVMMILDALALILGPLVP
jgi:hypothetical protein